MGGDAGESSRAIETARYRDGRPGLRAYGDNERSSPRETVKFSMFRGYREPIATPLILLTATTWTVQRIGISCTVKVDFKGLVAGCSNRINSCAGGGGLFWATSLEKNYRRRDRAHLVPPAAGWMQQSAVPSCAILSVGSTGDEMIQ
jgi:hypothetical protein